MTFTRLKRKTAKTTNRTQASAAIKTKSGSCPNLVDMPKLHIHPERKAMDEQPNDNIVHRDGSRKADGLSHLAVLPGIVDVQSATLDDPDALPPTLQIQTADRLGWMTHVHDLPEFERFPA